MRFGIPKMSLKRDIMILLSSVLVMHIASYIVIPIFPIILKSEKNINPAQIGSIIAIGSLAFQAGSALGGPLSDRLGKRTAMVFGAFMQACALFGYGISESFLLIFSFAILNGVGSGIYSPTVKAAIASLASDSAETRTTAFSLRGIAANVGVSIAGLLTLLLSNQKSAFIFFTGATVYLLLSILTWMLLPKDCGGKSCPMVPFNSYILIFKNKPFIIFTILSILISAIYAQLSLLLPLRADVVLENGKIVGTVWTITSITVIIFQGIISKFILQKFHPFTSLFWAVLFFGGGIFLLGLSNSFIFLTFSAIVFLIGEMLMLPTTDSLTSQLAQAELIGAYFGIAGLIAGVGTALGNFLGGKIIDVYGVNTTLYPWMLFAIAAIAIAITIFAVKRFPIMKEIIKQ
ncbi:MFS transporter [Anaerosolibacter sp.]|uniref:MFS transporter n=1 Tax=Anaerosolibacter sp. TaxID=1872527 RepID=UPI0039F109A6